MTAAYARAGLSPAEVDAVAGLVGAVESADSTLPYAAVARSDALAAVAALDRLVEQASTQNTRVRVGAVRNLTLIVNGSATIGGAVADGSDLDLPHVWAILRETGLVIFPGPEGRPAAFLVSATPTVVEWIAEHERDDSLPWQRSRSGTSP